MRFTILGVLGLLTVGACDVPSPEFLSATQSEVTIDGVRYSVHRKGARAEAIKITRASVLNVTFTMDMGVRAIEAATGCRVRNGSVQGDIVQLRATLDCPGEE
ncbi:MAG: hypothetical protein ACWA47_05755 [Brevirhabdus sp.]